MEAKRLQASPPSCIPERSFMMHEEEEEERPAVTFSFSPEHDPA